MVRFFGYFILLIWCSAGYLNTLSAQTMYPGDVNQNGRVNGIDVLWWAQAQGNVGPRRSNASLRWEPQLLPPAWAAEFPDGSSHAFADLNGDGIVDLFDLFGITINELETGPIVREEVRSPDGEVFPRLHAHTADTLNVVSGESVTIPIQLGASEVPVEEILGISFLATAAELLIDDIFVISDEDSWQAGQSSWNALTPDPDWLEEGQTGQNLTWFQANGQPASGEGMIGEVIIIIDDVSFLERDTTIVFTLEPLQLVGTNLVPLGVNGDSVYLRVFPDSTLRDELLSAEDNLPEVLEVQPQLEVFPNPVQDLLMLRWEHVELVSIQIYDCTGRLLSSWQLPAHAQTFQIPVSGLVAGSYLIEARTPTGKLLRTRCIKL
jgi:hypothetical protein